VGTRSFAVNVPAGTADVPTVSLSSNQSWLTVPATQAAGASGSLQFNTADLLAGGYTATVTATAPGYRTATLPVSRNGSPGRADRECHPGELRGCRHGAPGRLPA
jgi:hypothetical protein